METLQVFKKTDIFNKCFMITTLLSLFSCSGDIKPHNIEASSPPITKKTSPPAIKITPISNADTTESQNFDDRFVKNVKGLKATKMIKKY
jgi:hypothetical protein